MASDIVAHIIAMGPEFWKATYETIVMVAATMLFSTILGLPMGVLLVTTERGNILENQTFCNMLGWFVNVFRSLPFIILLIWLFPFTRLVMGTSVGTKAVIVPLVVGSAPFVARIVETSLKEVDKGGGGSGHLHGGKAVANY